MASQFQLYRPEVCPTRRIAPTTDQPDRKVQTIELAVFLFLIVPAMSTSFMSGDRSVGGRIFPRLWL
jgi:hypothetical protein